MQEFRSYLDEAISQKVSDVIEKFDLPRNGQWAKEDKPVWCQ